MASAGASERSPLLRSSSNDPAEPESESVKGSQKDGSISVIRGVLLSISFFILIFILTTNISLLSTIQSSIATDLQAFTSVSWFTSTFLIAVTSLIPVAGRLCRIFSPKWYLLVSIVIEACGLLITSQARPLWLFLVGRAITGIGCSAVTPVALNLVTEFASKKRRGLLFGCVNLAYTSGVACGAIIAGALEPVVGWRAVFLFQIPVILPAVLLAFFAIPPPKADLKEFIDNSSLLQKLGRIDFFGVFSFITSIVLLLYSLAAPKVLITPIILSICGFILFVFVEAKWALEPIIPVQVLRSRGSVLTGLATTGVMAARWGVLFYTPVYAIAVRGWSQTHAGMTLIPTNFGFAVGGLLAGWLHIRRSGSFYIPVLVAYIVFSATHFALSQVLTPDSNIYVFLGLLFCNGFTVGALLNYSLAHLLHLTLSETHFIVVPLNAMFRSISGSFGSSISGGLFLRTLHSTLSHRFKQEGIPGRKDLVNKLIGTPKLVQQLTGIEKQIAVDGYVVALRTLFLFGCIFALAMVVVQAGTGWVPPKPVKEDDTQTNHATVGAENTREPAVN